MSSLKVEEREGKEDIFILASNTVSIDGKLFRLFSSRKFETVTHDGRKVSVPLDVIKLYPVKASEPVRVEAPAKVIPAKVNTDTKSNTVEDRMSKLQEGLAQILRALGNA